MGLGTHFRAPWGTKLWAVTLVILAIVVYGVVTSGPPTSLVLVGVTLLAAAFMVRGYSVVDGKLLVHRLGWSTKFDLANLEAAEFSPHATMGSIRVMGVGGLFGFIGSFRNELLGMYRAYATDSTNTVVLDFGGSKVVVTPDNPAEFVAALESRIS